MKGQYQRAWLYNLDNNGQRQRFMCDIMDDKTQDMETATDRNTFFLNASLNFELFQK
jgi:hypothetical protein